MCFLKANENVNFLSQSVQLKGLSPVWIRMCILKLDLSINFLSQSLQLKGVSRA